MDEKKLLAKKFKETGHDKISEFIRDVKSELTQETWGAILNRGNRPATKTLLTMASELNFTVDELKEILAERGEHQIAAWIAPTSLTSEEKKIIESVRALNGDTKKLKLVKDLLAGLRG